MGFNQYQINYFIMKKYIFLSIFILYANQFLVAQKQDTLKLYIEKVFQKISYDKKAGKLSNLFEKWDYGTLLKKIKPFEKDSILTNRQEVANAYLHISKELNDTILRKNALRFILSNCIDSNSKVSNFKILGRISQDADFYFSKKDFDSNLIDSVYRCIKNRSDIGSYGIPLLTGWLEIKDAIPYLKKLFINGKNKANYEFQIMLALGRMGEKEFTLKSIEKIKKRNIGSVNRLMSDEGLRYLKQPEVLDLFVELLDSKEVIRGFAGGGGEEGVPNRDVAFEAFYRILSLLKNDSSFSMDLKNYMLSNFYDKTEFDNMKLSLANSKLPDSYKQIESSAKSYRAAKEWILKNKSKYVIDFDRSKYY
jgi:hypothetical protein